jgi:phytanoyl-CoA dioxygenase PhyH
MTKESCTLFAEHSLSETPLPAIGKRADDGYGITEAVIGRTEILNLLRALESSSLKRSLAGARHLMSESVVSDVANDVRLLTVARTFLGTNPIPYRATLFDKSSAQNWLVPWHQDTALPLCERRDIPGWGPWSVKAGVTYAHAPASMLSRIVALRLHFDDSRDDNGPLRVLPGTHVLGVLSDAEIQRVVRELRQPNVSWAPAESLPCGRSFYMPRPRPGPIVRAECCTSNTPRRWTRTMASESRSHDHEKGIKNPGHHVVA